MVATLAGTAGLVGAIDATGSYARFNQPNGVTVDGSGNVYVADTGNGAIRKITPLGVVTTLAGSIFNRGNRDGSGLDAWFSSPTGVAADTTGNIYVSDAFTNTIRKVNPAGTVSTIAGSASFRGGSADGTGTAAQFSYPSGIAVDSAGNLYVADTYNDTIRKITSDGKVATLAGFTGMPNTTDGTGPDARFNQPTGVAVDSSGTVYVADTVNCTIRQISPAGVVSTVAGTVFGNAGIAGFADGVTSTSLTLFNQPRGLVPDGLGNLYVADTGNAAIRKLAINGATATLSTPAMTQGSVDQTGSVITPPITPVVPGGGGATTSSGGAIEPRFLALLALLAVSRWLTRKK
jgi:sugar lactone lactonase YvrE